MHFSCQGRADVRYYTVNITQIEDAFIKNGISLDDIDKVKIEIDRSGKIVVGGVDDPDKARAIENTLNRDKTLAGKISQFQRDEKELSQRIMDYAGATLFELTMTERGNFNQRIQKTVPDREDEYYQELRFLGGTLDTVVSRDDIAALGFGRGRIDFSGEVDVNAKPEENIRESVDSLTGKINEAFDGQNAELAERLGTTPVAGSAGAARDNRFLSLANATITVDNYGKVTIDGLLSADEETHRKGVEIIEELVRDMLNETEENSYHLNILTGASNVLLRRKADELGLGELPGAMQGRVSAKIANGSWGGVDVSLPSGN